MAPLMCPFTIDPGHQPSKFFLFVPLQLCLAPCVGQEKVTKEDIAEIHHRFVALDRDNNGFVTRDEIGADRDLDGDGFINPDEL